MTQEDGTLQRLNTGGCLWSLGPSIYDPQFCVGFYAVTRLMLRGEKNKGGGPGLPASFCFPFRGKIGQPDGGRLTGRVLACA